MKVAKQNLEETYIGRILSSALTGSDVKVLNVFYENAMENIDWTNLISVIKVTLLARVQQLASVKNKEYDTDLLLGLASDWRLMCASMLHHEYHLDPSLYEY